MITQLRLIIIIITEIVMLVRSFSELQGKECLAACTSTSVYVSQHLFWVVGTCFVQKERVLEHCKHAY